MEQPSQQARSYQAHETWYARQGTTLARLENAHTIDYWRQERIFQMIAPLLRPEANRWLTVGDGLGTDANWLLGQGADALATDITDTVLRESYAQGFIKEYRRENAEALSFADSSFDYALCKDAYHHFPRPYVALYEMIRVAREGVVLIEPSDVGVQVPLVIALKNLFDRWNPQFINRLWRNRFSFEPVGNYVYKVSERELEKVAMGLGLAAVAFKGFHTGHDNSPDMSQPVTNRQALRRVQRRLRSREALSRLGVLPYQEMIGIIFKKAPTTAVRLALQRTGYKYVALPPNPYAS